MSTYRSAARKMRTVACAAVILLAGCAQPGHWVKPGMMEAQWKQDNYECTRDATYQPAWTLHPWDCWCGPGFGGAPPLPAASAPRLNYDLYRMCLEAKGYEWRPAQ